MRHKYLLQGKEGFIMATKQEKTMDMQTMRQVGRKAALAYVGAFGVAADEAGKLFERFVKRGERMEKDARVMVQQNEKQLRQMATRMKREQKTNLVQANKTVKKAVKRVEKAMA
jgi:hypothetical protein